MRIGLYCQRQRCSPRSVVSGDIRLMPLFVGVHCRVEVVSDESAVVENASFLHRSLYLPVPYEVPHWLHISKFTRFRAVPCDSMALVLFVYRRVLWSTKDMRVM